MMALRALEALTKRVRRSYAVPGRISNEKFSFEREHYDVEPAAMSPTKQRLYRSSATALVAAALSTLAPAPSAQADCADGWGDMDGSGQVDAVDVECALLTAIAEMQGAQAPGCSTGNMGGDPTCDESYTVHDAQVITVLALELPLGAAADFNSDGCLDLCQYECGDDTCSEAVGEDCSKCPKDCGICPDSCCLAQGEPGCNDPVVEACVCEISSFCCEFFWDESCVALGRDFCESDCFVPACDIEDEISCGESIVGTTVGGSTTYNGYSCVGWNEAGPERVFGFLPKGDFPAKVSITAQPGVDLDVFALGSDCGVGNCLSYGSTEAIFDTKKDSAVYLVVDGIAGAQGTFTITLNCADDCDTAALCGANVCGTAKCNGIDISCGTCPAGEACDGGQCVEITFPGCPGPGDCFTPSGTTGCNDVSCCALVCQNDPFCCNTSWDSACASGAVTLCTDCGDGTCSAADGEDCSSCAADCACAAGSGCSKGSCLACTEENWCTGVAECGSVSCGKQTVQCAACPNGETCSSLNLCYACGDGVCENGAGESCANCELDCACAGADVCVGTECIMANVCELPANPLTITCGTTIASNNGLGTNAISEYNCVSWDQSGPEQVYVFTAPATTLIEVTLEDGDEDLDAFLLSPSCSDQSCVEYGGGGFEYDVVEGQTYYIVVDGYAGDVDSYTINLACQSLCTPEAACTGKECGSVSCFGSLFDCGSCEAGEFCGSDQKCYPCGDGQCTEALGENCINCAADCGCKGAGEVCTADATCEAGVSCPPTEPQVLSCGDLIEGNNSGGSTVFDQYPECITWNESGPEVIYTFVPTANTTVSFELDTVAADLDLFLLTGACSDKGCVEYGSTTLEFDVVAGQQYWLVVDGFNGASDSFTLKYTCANACTQEAACGNQACGVADCFDQSFNCGSCPAGEFCVEGTCGNTSPFPICPSQGSCTLDKNTPGCDDEACCIAVCSQDSFCCNSAWDTLCAGAAGNLCGP
jgi:hypothetical protein